ncbi:hypothetical protein F4820DRAFT_447072 [Hypoxylon rubiginosum]|uniref:Uncharacterized protein n=1 Tax=Hypoxylon rubiginosum TaxID=110542 RepID=A0ACB9Z3L2_9PEZI|nr:hypothetical protein F4820DRAFT_447072 [Hypoxylon rubiginosum]
MAKSCLPAIPLAIFGVIEPAMLVWAYIIAHRDLPSFYAAQAPNHLHPSSSPVPAPALVLLLQLVNVYLLLAAVAVVCSWTTHASVSRGYLVAVAFADYGHVWACYKGVGPDLFWDLSRWNDMLWGAVGVSLALNVFRWLTVLGAFGSVRDPRDPAGAVATGGPAKKNA